MANDIGSQKSFNGTSMGLNTQKGDGAQKPMPSAGKDNPGGTKPDRPECRPVPMPK